MRTTEKYNELTEVEINELLDSLQMEAFKYQRTNPLFNVSEYIERRMLEMGYYTK